MRRRLTSWVLTLAVIALAALRAGSRLDAAPHPGELARVEAGLHPRRGSGEHSPPARWFYGLTLPAHPRIEDPIRLLPWARLASVFGVLAATCLLYGLLAMLRGRVTALLACAGLALLPPAGLEGYVLRPEVPAVVLGTLGVLPVALLPRLLAARGGGGVGGPLLLSAAVGFLAGVLFGLAAACLPQAGIHLLVPGGVLLLATARALARYPRLVRRLGVLRVPYRALRARLLPWLVLCLVAMLAMIAVMEAVLEGGMVTTAPTLADHDLLPAAIGLAGVVSVLAFVGGLRLLLSAGRRFGRTGRVGGDLVLLWWVLALTTRQVLAEPGADALPAALPLAALVGEGGLLAATLGLGALARRV